MHYFPSSSWEFFPTYISAEFLVNINSGQEAQVGVLGRGLRVQQYRGTTDLPASKTAFRFLSTLQKRYRIDSRHALKREPDFRRPCCVENLSTVEAITSSNPISYMRATASLRRGSRSSSTQRCARAAPTRVLGTATLTPIAPLSAHRPLVYPHVHVRRRVPALTGRA